MLLALGLIIIATAGIAAASPNSSGLMQHPCVLVTQPDLVRLRAMGVDTAENKLGFAPAKVWGAFRVKADGFVKSPTYSYEVQIPANGDQPTEKWSYTLSDQDPPPHPRTSWYPPWTAMFQEREDSISTRLKTLSFAYVMTGDRQYFEAAKSVALHLAHWSSWTDTSYGGGTIKCCLDTGHAAQNVALFYDWCYELLTPEERTTIRTALSERGVKAILAGVDNYPAETNGFAVLTCGLGLAALALRPEEPEAAEWLNAAIEKTRKSLSMHGRDGGAYEGPMYGTYLLDSFAVFLNALEVAKVQQDLFQHPYLATMDQYCIGLLGMDTKTQPCFGDGSPTRGYPKTMSFMARHGSKAAAWYLASDSESAQINALTPATIDEFIVFDASKIKPELPTFNPSCPFVDIGHAVLRDGYNPNSAFVVMKAGPPDKNIGHNHYDHNSFVLSYLGDWLVGDRGYHHFTHPPSTKFSLGTMGHSSLVIDRDDAYLQSTKVPDFGHDQVSLSGAKIAQFFSSPVYDFAKGEAAAVYNQKDSKVLDRYDRSLYLIKPDMVVVRDQIAAPAPHRFSLLLAADRSAEAKTTGDGFLTTLRAAELESHVWATQPLEYHAALYPQAESYGMYLESQTPPTQSVEFTSLLLPRAIPNPVLIRNGDFEKGLLGWTIRAGDDAPHHATDTTVAFEGKQSGRIEKSGYYYSQHFSVPVGTKLKTKFAALTKDTTDGGASVCFYFWKGGTSFGAKQTDKLTPTTWTEYTLDAVAPEGTDEVCIALNYFGNGVGWFDGVTVAADIPPRLAPPPLPVVKRVTPNGSQFEVRRGDKTIAIFCGTAGSDTMMKASRGVLHTDGELAFVEWDGGGNISRVGLHQGTYVRLNGENILLLPQRADVALSVQAGGVDAVVSADLAPHAPLTPVKLTLGRFASGMKVNINQKLF